MNAKTEQSRVVKERKSKRRKEGKKKKRGETRERAGEKASWDGAGRVRSVGTFLFLERNKDRRGDHRTAQQRPDMLWEWETMQERNRE